ncbi:MAG: VTT domain-containing protein [Pseudomonadota bacterium]
MDSRAVTSLIVSLILILFVVLMLIFGQKWINLGDNGDRLSELLAKAAGSPWAVLVVISVFGFLALTGFPQILLITATVLAFGPAKGAFYAWVATLSSATLTFGIGHFLGGQWVRQYGGERVQSLINFLGRHGIAASAVIRVVPSAPFIVVNAAAGAAHIPLWKYWLGTGFGIIPKIAIVAVLGAFAPDQSNFKSGVDGILEFFTTREPAHFALLAGIIGVWCLFLYGARQVYVRMRGPAAPSDFMEDSGSEGAP